MTDDRLYDVSKLVAKLTTITAHTCDFATLLRDIDIHENITDIITLLTIDHVTDITPILSKIGIERALFICDELCAPAIVRKIIRKKIILNTVSQIHTINLNVANITNIYGAYKRGYKIIPNIGVGGRFRNNPKTDNNYIALLNDMYVRNLRWVIHDVDRNTIEKNIKEIRAIELYDTYVNARTIDMISICTNVESLYCESTDHEYATLMPYADPSSFRNLHIMPHLRYISANTILNNECLELCTNIYKLDASCNSYITTCDPFAHSLRVLDASYKCGICDIGLIRCTHLKNINVDDNCKITTCAPFAKTLKILSAECEKCGINDQGLLLCTNLKKLYCNYNCNITTCAPFAKTIRVLHTIDNQLSDSGLLHCTKLNKLDHSYNKNITTFAPFAKTLKVLCTRNMSIGEDEIKLCDNLVELYCTDDFKTITDNPFPKSLRRLHILLSNNPNTKFYHSIKTCANLQLLNIDYNTNIPTDIILPPSLTVLHGCGARELSDTALKLCTNLRELYVSYNNKITSCAPFARTLKILHASFNHVIDDAFIRSCTNLEVLDSDGSKKITIKI